MKIKFFKAGKWAGKPWEPQIKVIAEEVREVSDYLAKIVIECGAGELYEDKKEDQTAQTILSDIRETENQTKPATSDTKINEIGLSESIISRLAGDGVTSIAELIEKTEQDILNITGIGKTSLKNITAVLSKIGLSLKEGE